MQTKYIAPVCTLITFALAALGIAYFYRAELRAAQRELTCLTTEHETLRDIADMYIVQDSLHAAKAQALELTVAQLERLRASDAALIAQLQTKGRDLEEVVAMQSETITRLAAVPRDTVILVDSVEIKARAVSVSSKWYDFEGYFTDDLFTGELHNREYLVIAETVKYRRFLGFLWKTRKVVDREVDVVSKNPNTTITGFEYNRLIH